MYQYGAITDRISFIDNGLLGIAGVGVTYVVRGDEIALVETGTSLSAPIILEGLAALGIAPRDVRHILLTHVHMDHAGGAGALIDAMPDARVYIHGLTAEHLHEPSRLLRSAERALLEMYVRHGTVVPLPADRIVAAEGLRLRLAPDLTVHAIPSPGHSPDHLAYWIPEQAALWTGDGIGISLPAHRYSGPVSPPPGFDPMAQRRTFDTLAKLPAEHLLFSHWGREGDAQATIARLHEDFEDFFGQVERHYRAGTLDPDAIGRAVLPSGPLAADSVWLIGGWTRMGVRGIVRWLEREDARR